MTTASKVQRSLARASGAKHLFANSVPLATVGAAMLFLYPHSALRMLPAVYLSTGALVWVFGCDSVHLAADRLARGLVSYVFVAGLPRLDRRAISASLRVVLMYGSDGDDGPAPR
jgi:hypothetical protein